MYTIHQLRNRIGKVSTSPQTNGKRKSARRPSVKNSSQKMRFFSIRPF